MNDQTPTPRPDAPLQVSISEPVIQALKGMPPEATDALAAAVREIIDNPDTISNAQAMYPVPVDHSPGRENVYVPATRSVSYLRNAVADISPETVRYFDDELRAATAYDPEQGADGQIRGLRVFVLRWIDYIAIQGDHDTARHIEAAQTHDELAERYAKAMREAHMRYYPDAGDQFGNELSVQTRPRPGGGHTAICPVTQLRADGSTPEEAQNRLRAMLLEWVTG